MSYLSDNDDLRDASIADQIPEDISAMFDLSTKKKKKKVTKSQST
jgi:hypothetical protein